jgi:DNA-binding transcriptional LysR family regulator
LRNRPPRLSDIARHRLLSLPLQSSTRKMIDRVFAERGIETRGVIEAGNCQTALEFATRGVGIAIVHSLCAHSDHRLQLSYIDLDQQFGRVEFSMLYRKGTQENPVLLGLVEELTSRDTPTVQTS